MIRQLQTGKNDKEEGQRARWCAGLQLDRLWPGTKKVSSGEIWDGRGGGLSGPGDDRGKPSGRLAHLYNESSPPFTGCHGNYTATMLLRHGWVL